MHAKITETKPGKLACNDITYRPKAVAERPGYLKYLRKGPHALKTADGCSIDIWELSLPTDNAYLSDWALRFRRQYCPDDEIDELREGTELSRAEFLLQLVFPDKQKAPGPGIRSGDFAELLIADYVEYHLGFWVPRDKYAEKASRDESVKGVDILGFKVVNTAFASENDTLLAFEVKAQLVEGKYEGRLQTAIDDSSKDYLRSAMTLNATKRRLRRAGQLKGALIVQRFQNLVDRPYVYRSGAAAVLSGKAYDETALQGSTVAEHQNTVNLELIVIRGTDLMTLTHALYQKAADEA